MHRPISLAIFALALPFATASLAQTIPDPKLMDKKADPCEDFYRYACGAWVDKTVVSDDRLTWDRGAAEIEKRNQTLLHSLLEGYAKGVKTSAQPQAQKLGAFYSACMKDAGDNAGLLLVKKHAGFIDKMAREDLPVELAWLHLHGATAFFSLVSEQDLKEPLQVIAEIDESGLGLPARAYYLDQSEMMQHLRHLYRNHLEKMLSLIGESPKNAKRGADAVLHLETQLAEQGLDAAEMRDPEKLYHKIKDLRTLAPALDWSRYFKGLGVPMPAKVNVTAPKHLKTVDLIVSAAPKADLRAYLKIRLLEMAARALPGPLLDEHFDFNYHTLYGVKELPPKWKRCVDATDQFLGFALGRSYVGSAFSATNKELAKRLAGRIESEMGVALMSVPWMSPKTQKLAIEKAQKLLTQIGYPEEWPSYDGLKVGPSYLENRLEATALANAQEWAKIGKSVDRKEWIVTPSVVNGLYDIQLNRLIYPAGILQSPLFGAKLGLTANYAGVGVLMAHELTHAFDGTGSQFDGSGAVINWWDDESRAEFLRRAQCLLHQYDQFSTVGGGHVSGELTLGENIADQGGLKLAYNAWQSELPEKIKGNMATLNGESKKFFVSYAQAMCAKETDASEQLRVNSDSHAPARYRVKGALMNFPEFARVYKCKSGAAMAPPEPCGVW